VIIPTEYYKWEHPDDPQMKNKKNNTYLNLTAVILGLFVMFGSGPYIIYLSNIKWTQGEYRINTSDSITAVTCSKYY
jgi:hypothetical protein